MKLHAQACVVSYDDGISFFACAWSEIPHRRPLFIHGQPVVFWCVDKKIHFDWFRRADLSAETSAQADDNFPPSPFGLWGISKFFPALVVNAGRSTTGVCLPREFTLVNFYGGGKFFYENY